MAEAQAARGAEQRKGEERAAGGDGRYHRRDDPPPPLRAPPCHGPRTDTDYRDDVDDPSRGAPSPDRVPAAE